MVTETIYGNFLTIDQYNQYFNDIAIMLLDHYDTEQFRDTVIVLGSNLKMSVSDLKKKYPGKKIIIYQLEQLVDCNTWWNPKYVISTLTGADEIWDYDILNIKYCETYYNMKDIKFYPLRYSSKLNDIIDAEHDIDLLYYGSLSERRMKWLLHIRQRFWFNVKFWIVGGNSKEQLNDLLSRSKIILNIHTFEPYNRQEQARMFYPLINGKCVLSEMTQANHLEGCIVETNFENICNSIEFLLNENRYKKIGESSKLLYKTSTETDSAYNTYKEKIINKFNYA